MVNAVVDALSPYGITDIDMPASPWKVWQAIQESQGREAGEREADLSGRPSQTMESTGTTQPDEGTAGTDEPTGGDRL